MLGFGNNLSTISDAGDSMEPGNGLIAISGSGFAYGRDDIAVPVLLLLIVNR